MTTLREQADAVMKYMDDNKGYWGSNYDAFDHYAIDFNHNFVVKVFLSLMLSDGYNGDIE